jgi:hypothetical protein
MSGKQRTSNALRDTAVAAWLRGRLAWQSATLCSCSGRKIRRRLIAADLLIWLAIVMAAVAAWKLG